MSLKLPHTDTIVECISEFDESTANFGKTTVKEGTPYVVNPVTKNNTSPKTDKRREKIQQNREDLRKEGIIENGFFKKDHNDDDESEYRIYNKDILGVLGNKYEEVKIPPNLTIYATMNTCDQNVFTLDTAFKRRWRMKRIPNAKEKLR